MKQLLYMQKFYPLRQFAVFVVLCVLTGCIPAVLIYVESYLLDSAIGGTMQNAADRFARYIGIFVLILVLNLVLTSLLRRNMEHHAILVGRKMDEKRLEKANRVPFALTETQNFHELFEQAEKAPELDSAIYQALQVSITGGVNIVASLIVLLTIDWWTAVSLVILLLFGIWMNQNAAKNADGFWGEYIKNMRHANYMSSLLLHREYAAERKIFDYPQEIEARYEDDFATAVQKNCELGKKRFRAEFAVTVFSAIYSITIVLLLLRPLSMGKISFGVFGATFSATNKLRNAGSQLYGAVFTISSSYRQLSGFFSFLQLDEEQTCDSVDRIDLEKGIEFCHVSFQYPGTDIPVLEDVSFHLQPGIHYALVGENGCGKTTLVKLLLGLYQPTAGEIRCGGKNLKTMSSEEKQHLFSVMFQDFYRYPLSVRENVSLSSSQTPKHNEILHTLNLLGMKAPFLSEDKGLDRNLMMLKTGGFDMSGGEWQKVTAVRCILSDAPIAVLDEPNAALDPVSEGKFYSVCQEMLKKKTTLFISHRLGSVKSADQIIVLRNHYLIAMNSHETLMDTCEYYKNLFETQRGLYYEA